MSKFAYGKKPFVMDEGDKNVVEQHPHFALAAPRRAVDWTSLQSPVEDQGNLGACTAFGWGADREYMMIAGKQPLVVLSKLELYFHERQLEGDVSVDGGAQVRTGARVLQTIGVRPESMWPYDPKNFATPPPDDPTDDRKFLVPHAYLVPSLPVLKNTLHYGHCVPLGFTVYESFESDACMRTGDAPMPEQGEQVLGGHCVLAVGYDDRTQYVTIKNSWGKDVGRGGYFRLPYAFWIAGIVDEMWVVA